MTPSKIAAVPSRVTSSPQSPPFEFNHFVSTVHDDSFRIIDTDDDSAQSIVGEIFEKIVFRAVFEVKERLTLCLAWMQYGFFQL
jgi:hypothetical protein